MRTWGGGPKCHVFLYIVNVRSVNFYKHGIANLTNWPEAPGKFSVRHSKNKALHTHIHTHVHIHIYAYTHTHTHIHIHTYIHTHYTHTHTHTHTHIHTHYTHRAPSLAPPSSIYILSIFSFSLPLSEIASYADDNNPYTCRSKPDLVVENLKDDSNIILKWVVIMLSRPTLTNFIFC